MNDQHFDTTGWRDQSPSLLLKGDILGKVARQDRTRRLKVLGLGLVTSGLGFAALSSVLLFSSAPLTLAQVIAADEKAVSMTCINRRIMGDPKKSSFTTTTREVADVMTIVVTSNSNPKGVMFGYIDRTGTVTVDTRFNLVTLDNRQKLSSYAYRRPKLSEFLKDFKNSKVEKDFDWNGRKVTRFTCKVVLNNTDVDQELLVDPKTSLPIRFTNLRDHRSWGDEYTYDYSKLDPKSLKPSIPNDALIVDHAKLRTEIVKIASSSNASIPFLDSSPYQLAIPLKLSLLPKLGLTNFELRISTTNGAIEMYKGTFGRFGSSCIRLTGGDDKTSAKDFAVLTVDQLNPHWKDDGFKDNVNGSLIVNGKTYTFSKLPVIKSGFLPLLLQAFEDKYKAAHPEDQPRKPWTPPKK